MGRWQTIQEPEFRWAYWGQPACVSGGHGESINQAKAF